MPKPVALWVSPVSNLAGVARHIIDVARVGLGEFELVVTAPEGPLLDELRRIDCPVVPLDLDQPVPKVVAALRRTIQETGARVVHSHLAKADFLTAMATTGLPVTVVSTEHHIPEDPLTFHGTRLKAGLKQTAHRVRLRRFDHLIAVSESTKRDMLRYWNPKAPVTVVLNGVDRPDEKMPRSPGLRVLSLTRLSPEKNLDATLRVFADVHARHPEARLTVGGTGEEADRLVAMAHQLGVDEVTSFAGFVDPQQAMAEHDVLIQPSKADNLSYTLLDAVNAGMGVVASAIGGNGEIVPPRCTRPLDDEPGMADAVIEQGLELELRPQLPENIPDVQSMIDQVLAVYTRAGVHA